MAQLVDIPLTKRTIVLMKIVADANTFLAVALNEPEREQIIQMTVGHALVAPEVLPFEIANALTAMGKRGILESEEILSAWEAANAAAVQLRESDTKLTLDIASTFGIYAYDAYYLECALMTHAPLLTLDKGMKEVARKLEIERLEVWP